MLNWGVEALVAIVYKVEPMLGRIRYLHLNVF